MIEDALAVRDEMCEVGAKNNFFVLPSEEQRIANPSFFLWGLEPKLTRIVEAYIRLPISYLGVGLLRSKPDGDNSKSRCWHRDTQDRRHVKVTVYFNDVNEAGGPFQFLPHTVTPFFLPTWYSKVYKKNFMSDDKMSKFVSPDKWKSCTGASGTVIFFEPNGFHRGKIPTESERFAAIYKYASRHPKHPDFCDPHFSANELNTYQQYLTPEQKEMVWKIR
ncbi:MAG: 2OG-Fe(II) oxygenase [Geitlerinemataceae cyanobacterium]